MQTTLEDFEQTVERALGVIAIIILSTTIQVSDE